MIERSQPTDTTRPRPGTRTRTLAFALACAWLAATPCQAKGELYRWVDESGTTVYSQRPPPGTTPAKPIKLDPPPPAAQVEQADERLRGQAERDADQRAQQARDAAEERQKAADQVARQAACAAARRNLEAFEKHGNERLQTAEGKIVTFSKDELASQKAEAQKQIKEYCK
ncbi:DUF4124 domain-containing protein [uncultured Thiodictyon sp.]|uniref:DUF4124 domain-containing protein n=1 Tax=uncultured Thiodictyon sp. TaxID=1846217 RepID=UPI0025F9A1B8|nr:DUF4124 domain-containing protein [uncultured Thiodictyon sp.]